MTQNTPNESTPAATEALLTEIRDLLIEIRDLLKTNDDAFAQATASMKAAAKDFPPRLTGNGGLK